MLIRWFIYCLTAYCAISLYFYFFSDFYIFHPPKASYRDTEEIIKIRTHDGAIISALYLANKNANYTILVSHGNAEDVGQMKPFLLALHSKNFAVFAYDYHGYGTSSGKPTERNTYLDADAAYEYLTTQLHIPSNQIVLYGHSLGTALAIHLASQKPVAGLIIESPFVSGFRTVTPINFLPFDKYNNLAKIKKVKCPVLVIHGKKDSVIPFWHGVRLYDEILSPKKFLWLENAGHNDVAEVGQDNYWQAIVKFCEGLKKE